MSQDGANARVYKIALALTAKVVAWTNPTQTISDCGNKFMGGDDGVNAFAAAADSGCNNPSQRGRGFHIATNLLKALLMAQKHIPPLF
jgi:hypothetical protein